MHRVSKIIRNIFIAMVSILGIVALYRLVTRKKGPLVRVIAFHDVHDALWFESIIKMLARRFNLISPNNLVHGTLDEKRINVLVTFDDGYASWFDICAPILACYDVKALFFINSGLLDVADDSQALSEYVSNNLRLTPKHPLTWDKARELYILGHTLGGHTVHHRSLKQIGPVEAVTEVSLDKKNIEGHVGISLHDFAYPFGVGKDYSNDTEELVRGVGYERVYTAEPGFISSLDVHIPRTLIEKDQTPQSVHTWMLGGYDLFVLLKRKIKSL